MELYYTPPSDEIFEEVRQKAMEQWRDTVSHPKYIQEKIDRIEHIKNIGDNFMYIVMMFDMHHQWRLAQRLSEEANRAISDRLQESDSFLEVRTREMVQRMRDSGFPSLADMMEN